MIHSPANLMCPVNTAVRRPSDLTASCTCGSRHAVAPDPGPYRTDGSLPQLPPSMEFRPEPDSKTGFAVWLGDVFLINGTYFPTLEEQADGAWEKWGISRDRWEELSSAGHRVTTLEAEQAAKESARRSAEEETLALRKHLDGMAYLRWERDDARLQLRVAHEAIRATTEGERDERPAVPERDWSLKRIAWAYGCAKKGSEDEVDAHQMLVTRVRKIYADDQDGSGSDAG